MKMLEIFYLMLFFNVIMSVFGGIGLTTPIAIDNPMNDIATFSAILGTAIATLGGFYLAFSVLRSEKAPLWWIYCIFGVAFQGAYMTSFFTLWNPLSLMIPALGLFSVLITFVVESIFVLGMIQMTTGGFEGYK